MPRQARIMPGMFESASPILGQDRALEILQSALNSGRFHHAWIFSGPKGVGKFTTAMRLARVLLDPELRALPDALTNPSRLGHESRIQQQITQGTHPDLHIIRKELVLYSEDSKLRDKKQTNIPIDLLRERVIGGKAGETIHEAAAYRTAMLGHGKVFIIDEAELLAREAQNAMLKTLEEPPPQTWFFLITSQPEDLYATIHSRCQQVRFGRLDEKAMKQWLKEQKSEVGGQMSASEQVWALEFAEGSPGVAVVAMEYDFAEWQAKLDPMLADLWRGKFPVQMGATLGELADAFAKAWVANHKNASKDAANKDATRHLFALLAAHARKQLAALNDDVERWAVAIDLLAEAERQLDSNVNMKLLLDNLTVQWNQALSGVPA